MFASRGVLSRRAALGGGAFVAAGGAAVSLLAGITGNWIASLKVPGFFGTTPGQFVAFAVALVLSVVLTAAAVRWPGSNDLVSSRGGRAGEDPGTGTALVGVVAGDGSADRRFSIWSMHQFGPHEATVHTAIGPRVSTGSAMVPEPPTAYVARDHDPALVRDVAAASCGELKALILLIGGSSTGKTRSLYEAIHAHCPGFQVIRPHTAAALRALPVSGHLSAAPSVLWLNELQGFLGPNGTGLTRVLLADLYTASTQPLVVVATLWPDRLHALVDKPSDETRDTRELLAEYIPEVRRHSVPDRFSPPEIARARDHLRTHGIVDERLARAIADPNHVGFTQTLAGARELLDRYAHGSETTKLVLEAAADARRLGVEAALSGALLEAMADALWRETYGSTAPDSDWFPNALAQATAPLADAPASAVRALIPLRDPDGYVLADYLEQHLVRARANRVVRDRLWVALLHKSPPGCSQVLAQQARYRLRFRIELSFLRRAAAEGESGAYGDIADWFATRGRVEESEKAAREAISAAEPGAGARFANWLALQGRDAEAEHFYRFAVTASDSGANLAFADWLKQRRRYADADQVHRDAIAAGEPRGHHHLADWLATRGREGEIERVYRDAVNAGEVNAYGMLADWLVKRGRDAEAEQVYRAGIAAGDSYATSSFHFWLKRRRRDDALEELHRAAVAAGERGAHTELAAWLESVGRKHEAEQSYRDGIAADEHSAYRKLAELLATQGRESEMEEVYRAAVAAGREHHEFATWLEARGREDEAEEMYRKAIVAGGNFTYMTFGYWLASRGRAEEAEQVFRDAVTSCELFARRLLGQWLEARGREDEAEHTYRDGITAGDPDTMNEFGPWLTSHGRDAELVALSVSGADEEGRTVWEDGT